MQGGPDRIIVPINSGIDLPKGADYDHRQEEEHREYLARQRESSGSGFRKFITILGAAAAIKQNNNQNVNCRSNRIGNTVYTNCN